MRIDKYLKVARILKRRSVSKELAENDRIEINGRLAKPSSEVKVGDEIKITFGNRELGIKVLSIAEVKKKEEASDLYEIVYEKRKESIERNIEE